MSAPRRVPDLLLERLHLGELSPDEERELRRRLAATEPDGGESRLLALARSDADLRERLPPLEGLASVEARTGPRSPEFGRRKRRLWPWLGLAVAVGLSLLVIRPVLDAPPTPGGDGPVGLRPKGLTPLLVSREGGREGELVPVDPGSERLRAGDRIQLSVRLPEPRYIAVVSLDGRGSPTIHLEPTPTPVTSLELPSSFVLDDAPGFERFFLVASPRPLTLAPIERALHTLARGLDPANAPLPLPEHAYAEVTAIRLDKTSAPR